MNDSDRLDPALRKLIAILVVGAVPPLLDTTAVNIGVHAMAAELHTSVSQVQWVGTGYLLAMGMVVPLAGWVTDRLGGKRTWLLSVALFLVCSVLAGAAPGIGSLIAFRVLQGASSGLMMPLMQTLLVEAAGGKRLGRLMAAATVPAVVAPMLGPIVGGLLVDGAGWRWIFYLNVPIGLLALLLAWRRMAGTPPRGGGPLDVRGLLLVSPGVAALLYGLSGLAGAAGGRGAVAVGALVLGTVLLLAFVRYALRSGRTPIVDLSLFRARSFRASAMLLFLSGLSLFGGMLLLPLYLQQALHLSAFSAGLLMLVRGTGALVARSTVGKLSDRIGGRPLVVAGTLLTALPLLGIAWSGVDGGVLLLGGYLLVLGIGSSVVGVTLLAAAYRGLEPAQIPHASGVSRILLQVGGAFGTAVVGLLLAQDNAAFGATFVWFAGLTLLAIVPALLLPKEKPVARR